MKCIGVSKDSHLGQDLSFVRNLMEDNCSRKESIMGTLLEVDFQFQWCLHIPNPILGPGVGATC